MQALNILLLLVLALSAFAEKPETPEQDKVEKPATPKLGQLVGKPLGLFQNALKPPTHVAELMDMVDADEAKNDSEGFAQVRVTCDILPGAGINIGFFNWQVGDAACGVHCLAKGRSGGYCNGKKICVCR